MKSEALSPAAPLSSSARTSVCRGSERSLEQLPDDPERELPLQLAAARSQHLELPELGELPCLGQQPRLADPGAAFDDDKAALAVARGGEERLERGELRLTLEHQGWSGGLWQVSGSHRVPLRPRRGAPKRNPLRTALATDALQTRLLASAPPLKPSARLPSASCEGQVWGRVWGRLGRERGWSRRRVAS